MHTGCSWPAFHAQEFPGLCLQGYSERLLPVSAHVWDHCFHSVSEGHWTDLEPFAFSNVILASTTCLLRTIANLLRPSASWSCKESPRVAWMVHRTDLRTQTPIKVCHTSLSKCMQCSALSWRMRCGWTDRVEKERHLYLCESHQCPCLEVIF